MTRQINKLAFAGNRVISDPKINVLIERVNLLTDYCKDLEFEIELLKGKEIITDEEKIVETVVSEEVVEVNIPEVVVSEFSIKMEETPIVEELTEEPVENVVQKITKLKKYT
jgi:hypothetical protein